MLVVVDVIQCLPLPCGCSFKVKTLVAQLCLTLWGPMDCSPPGSSVHGISQARMLEWVAIPFSRGFPDPGLGHVSVAWQADPLALSHLENPNRSSGESKAREWRSAPQSSKPAERLFLHQRRHLGLISRCVSLEIKL